LNVSLDKVKIIENAIISMDMGNGRILGKKSRLTDQNVSRQEEQITVQIPNKDALLESEYNQLTMQFKGPFQLMFRAHNDRVAYQFVDESDQSTQVNNE